jgi:hypothetical protein
MFQLLNIRGPSAKSYNWTHMCSDQLFIFVTKINHDRTIPTLDTFKDNDSVNLKKGDHNRSYTTLISWCSHKIICKSSTSQMETKS